MSDSKTWLTVHLHSFAVKNNQMSQSKKKKNQMCQCAISSQPQRIKWRNANIYAVGRIKWATREEEAERTWMIHM